MSPHSMSSFWGYSKGLKHNLELKPQCIARDDKFDSHNDGKEVSSAAHSEPKESSRLLLCIAKTVKIV